jgi:hypothetical protein
VRRGRIRRVRLRGRPVYSFSSDVTFGYMWREQGFTYVESHYFGGIPRHDLLVIVRSLRQLGTEYRGGTSQGRKVILYRSSAGLDYYVEWTGGCPGGARFTTASPLVPVHRDGSFEDAGVTALTTTSPTRRTR